MANTTIQLKKSSTPSSKPTDLANGELAINFADGKLYYKNVANYVVEYTSSQSNDFGTVSANGTLLVADTTGDVLTMAVGNNITIVGDAVNDKVTIGLSNDVTIPGTVNVKSTFTHEGGVFFINNAAGAGGSDEGGEIQLANATSNQVLSGRISIDIYQNKLRFFETNSPNRGAFINLASAGAGVGTDLLATGSSAVDSVARDAAGSAFNKANNALANTDGITFGGTLNVSKNLSADRVISSNNGLSENFKIGDDVWIGDMNAADTMRVKGQQNSSNGYIVFGIGDGTALGRQGTNNLTYGGNTVWHAGNDGTGSGLDADFLDGQHGSYYGTATDVTSAFNKANNALSNTSGSTFNGDLIVNRLYANTNVATTLANPINDLIIAAGGANPQMRVAAATSVAADTPGFAFTHASGTYASPTATGAGYNLGTIYFQGYDGSTRVPGALVQAQSVGVMSGSSSPANLMFFTTPSGSITPAERIRILSTGNIGIGIPAPTSLLHVGGTANITTSLIVGTTNIVPAITSAYDTANAANVVVTANVNYTNTAMQSAFLIANTALSRANAANVVVTANVNYVNTAMQSAFGRANDAFVYANSTFVRLSAGNQTIVGNISVTGSLTVSGNTYKIDANTLVVQDPLIYLAGNNYVSDIVDIGFIANYVNATGSNVHTGLFRDATTKEYYLFQGYDQEPINNHIDPTGNNISLSVLNADIRTSNLNLAGTNAVTWITSAFAKANSSTATVINVDNISATRYIVFANNTTGNLVTANVTTGFTFNPSANNLSVANTVFATHFDNTSDRNLKENIKPIIDGSAVLNLNPVSFNWKATGEKSYGLIAQEVEPIIPEVVHTNDNGIKTIEYVQLISLLIAKIQDQQQQIDDINRRLNNMPSNP